MNNFWTGLSRKSSDLELVLPFLTKEPCTQDVRAMSLTFHSESVRDFWL